MAAITRFGTSVGGALSRLRSLLVPKSSTAPTPVTAAAPVSTRTAKGMPVWVYGTIAGLTVLTVGAWVRGTASVQYDHAGLPGLHGKPRPPQYQYRRNIPW